MGEVTPVGLDRSGRETCRGEGQEAFDSGIGACHVPDFGLGQATPARIRRVERLRVVVHGFVQGVGFRFAVERAARSHGVAGWVRNRSDGTVEAVFEGERDSVEAVVAFCRRGPRGAEVDRVDVTAETPEELVGFRVTG